MRLEAMKDLVRRHEEVINEQDLSVLDRDLSPDFRDHSAPPGAPNGIEGARAWLSGLLGAFPDLRSSIEDVIAEGDRVVVRKRWRGTHRGAFQGIDPTNRTVEFEGIVVWRVEDGKLIERWASIDRLTLFQGLGVLPRPFPPAAG